MSFVLYIGIFITTTLLIITLNDMILDRKKHIKRRLKNIKDMTQLTEEEILRLSIFDRLIKPGFHSLLKTIGNLAPKHIRHRYEEIINNAGASKNITFTHILFGQILGAIIFASFLLLISIKTRSTNMLFVLLGSLCGFGIPIYIMKIKASKRQKEIKVTLPNFLDLLYVTVEAGLGFDMALKRTSEKMPGVLSEEMNKVLDEITRGRSRREALKRLINRTGVDDLSYFVTSIMQAEQLGGNISNMLKIQSNTMRHKNKQRAEEAAMKIPVKMLFPLVLFIFPSLFIVVLGPALIRIITTLGRVM